MPELPEVETIRRDLEKKILNKRIVHVKVYSKKSVGGLSTKFVQALKGNAITQIDRRGKLMIWQLKRPIVIPSEAKGRRACLLHAPCLRRQEAWRRQGISVSTNRRTEISHSVRNDRNVALLVHLKMTGQLIYEKINSAKGGSVSGGKVEVVAGGHKLSETDIECLPNKWTRVVFVFADGGELFFNDLRLFGYMKLADAETVARALKKYGPEPPLLPPPARGGVAEGRGGGSFTFAYFSSLFPKRKNTNLKAFLLNQELVAGLGNIYVDEVCFCAGVKPSRRVGSVTKEEQKKLFSCIPKILNEALKHRGTTFRNFLDSSGKKGNYTDFLKVYDRDGKPCKKCKTIIKKTVVAGRGTHYCPKCQV